MCIGRNTKITSYNLQIITCFQKIAKKKLYLGVTIDNNLTFDIHINNICRKAGQNRGALLRITNYQITNQ